MNTDKCHACGKPLEAVAFSEVPPGVWVQVMDMLHQGYLVRRWQNHAAPSEAHRIVARLVYAACTEEPAIACVDCGHAMPSSSFGDQCPLCLSNRLARGRFLRVSSEHRVFVEEPKT